MFRLTGKRRGDVFAVADVASGSAGVAIVETHPGGPARVLTTTRSTLPFEERSLGGTVPGVVAQLQEAAQKALTAYSARKDKPQAHVSHAYAIIRAPWSHSRTIREPSEFQTETRIEEAMIGSLAREALREGVLRIDPERIFERSVVRVQLNGYPTSLPRNKLAHHIEVAILVSDCGPSVRSNISETLSKVFTCPPPTLRSETRAFLSVLRESAVIPKECFLVNMTSHGTSFVAVRKGVAAETLTISEGSRSVIKKIAGGKMPEETLSLMRMLALGQCESSACESIRASLAQAESALVKSFGEALAKMSAARRLPNVLVLSSHEDISQWLADFLSRIDFGQFTITTQPFSVKRLLREDLAGLVTFDEAAKPDIGLAVASALVNIENT